MILFSYACSRVFVFIVYETRVAVFGRFEDSKAIYARKCRRKIVPCFLFRNKHEHKIASSYGTTKRGAVKIATELQDLMVCGSKQMRRFNDCFMCKRLSAMNE